ncbi:MAG TPA: YchJ family metal-binding protein [Polyangiaceae bacterium]|jgi:SEC-C motif-containing protein
MSAKACPCTSGLAYAACCGPYHRGEREAPTPEALMRSRFAAFARADAAYLWRTLHADHEDRARPEAEVLRALRDGARAHRYVRLTILEARGDLVLFRAGVFQKGRDVSFVELSRFAHDGVGWRYLSGEGRAASESDPGDPNGLTIEAFAAGGT